MTFKGTKKQHRYHGRSNVMMARRALQDLRGALASKDCVGALQWLTAAYAASGGYEVNRRWSARRWAAPASRRALQTATAKFRSACVNRYGRR